MGVWTQLAKMWVKTHPHALQDQPTELTMCPVGDQHQHLQRQGSSLKDTKGNFPGGPIVKNPPHNAGKWV